MLILGLHKKDRSMGLETNLWFASSLVCFANRRTDKKELASQRWFRKKHRLICGLQATWSACFANLLCLLALQLREGSRDPSTQEMVGKTNRRCRSINFS